VCRRVDSSADSSSDQGRAALSRFKKNPRCEALGRRGAWSYANGGSQAKYLGRDNSIEKLRPLFAAEALQKAASKNGPNMKATRSHVGHRCRSKKYNIKALTPKRTIHLHGKDLVESVKTCRHCDWTTANASREP